VAEFTHEPVGYQICIAIGAPPSLLEGTRAILLDPKETSSDSVLIALSLSGLTPSDLRARSLVSFPAGTDPALAILVYTAITGFAGRYLDVLSADTLIEPSPLLRAALAMHQERPSSQPNVILVGATSDLLPWVVLDHQLTRDEATRIRWSRRLRFVPDTDLVTALSQFIVISSLRNRNSSDRLPYLCDGTEPFNEETPLDLVGIDLDALRLAALALRRQERSGDRDAIVEVLEPSDRDVTLQRAADIPIEECLRRLGAVQNPDTELWHCPRPSRHTNGDATASMKVQNDRVRCYRCDRERLDSLRLTMDVSGLSSDECATWLLSSAPNLAERVRA
jgi:hypothetical protein